MFKKKVNKEEKKKNQEKKIQGKRFVRQFATIGGISNYENYIKCSRGYMACITAYRYPKEVADLWLLNVVRYMRELDPNIIVKFDVIDYPHDLATVVNNMVDENEDNYRNANKSTIMLDSRGKIEELLELYERCKNAGEVLKLIQLRIYVFEKSVRDLEKLVKKVQDKMLSKMKILTSVTLGNALEDYKSLMKTDVLLGQEMPGETIARGFPFNSSYFVEENGSYFGRSSTGGIISVDVNKKNSQRPSNDMVIIGKKGYGKSELLRDIAYNKLLDGGRVIIADVEGEHIQFTKDNGGVVISIDDPSFSFNIMQILNTGESDFDKILNFHWTRLKAILKYMIPEVTTKQINMFIKACRHVYSAYGFFDCADWESLSIPKLEEPVNILKHEFQKLRENQKSLFTKRMMNDLEDLIEGLEQYVDPSLYGKKFNTNNKLDLSANLICFDMRSINRDEKNIQEFQLYNMNSLVWNEVVKNKGKAMLSIFFDEDHRFIKPTMPIESLDMRDMIVREARKYEGCIILATQSIREYMGTSTGYFADRIKSMLEMMTYHIFYNQDDSAIDLIKEIYPRIPRSYLNSLPTAQVGEMIFDIAGVRSLYGRHELTDQQIKLYDGKITNEQLQGTYS